MGEPDRKLLAGIFLAIVAFVLAIDIWAVAGLVLDRAKTDPCVPMIRRTPCGCNDENHRKFDKLQGICYNVRITTMEMEMTESIKPQFNVGDEVEIICGRESAAQHEDGDIGIVVESRPEMQDARVDVDGNVWYQKWSNLQLRWNDGGWSLTEKIDKQTLLNLLRLVHDLKRCADEMELRMLGMSILQQTTSDDTAVMLQQTHLSDVLLGQIKEKFLV